MYLQQQQQQQDTVMMVTTIEEPDDSSDLMHHLEDAAINTGPTASAYNAYADRYPLLYFAEYRSNNPIIVGNYDTNDTIMESEEQEQQVQIQRGSFHEKNKNTIISTYSTLEPISEDEESDDDDNDTEEESGNRIIEEMNMTRVGGGLQLHGCTSSYKK